MADIELMTLEDYGRATARARPRDLEHQEQARLFSWARENTGRWPELDLLFAIPNGGLRHIATAKKLKAEGVKAGVPDVFLPAPRNGYHGLFIEMKRPGGRPRVTQRLWLAALTKQGYRVCVACSFEEAQAVITSYLGGGEL